MAKKKVEVNEDMLKDIMVGDIPVFGRERPNYQEPKVIETEDSDTDSDEGTEAVASKPSTPKPRKKREETGTYKERYLVNIPASNRSHVYINREVADCIKRVLPVIAPDMSVSVTSVISLWSIYSSTGMRLTSYITKSITNH